MYVIRMNKFNFLAAGNTAFVDTFTDLRFRARNRGDEGKLNLGEERAGGSWCIRPVKRPFPPTFRTSRPQREANKGKLQFVSLHFIIFQLDKCHLYLSNYYNYHNTFQTKLAWVKRDITVRDVTAVSRHFMNVSSILDTNVETF
ncbi:hypothetical protein C0J52_21781 [Blattella germanica]|nr:hypothetical protein C0J52_21781 [Blattella germanica]